MNDYTSRILRIGIINSGMFDLLELNMDVKAIHLVGQNNVGKTSLISLIQFLYFHAVPEMTFPKSNPESLIFYFPREGGYILFEVRTVSGLTRTVGIYGEGKSESRKIFVFNGSFALTDFLDETNCVLPLKQAQPNLLQQDLRIFRRFEDYEKALLGQHSEGSYNVQLFDLSTKNYRLLRTLLRGLLRLDKLTSRDIKQFVIKIIETGAVKTRINIAHDYERKHADINKIRRQLLELKRLEPIIVKWQSLNEDMTTLQERLNQQSEQWYHTSSRLLDLLAADQQQTQTDYQLLAQKVDTLDAQLKKLIQKKAVSKNQIDDLLQTINTFSLMESYCAHYALPDVQKERDNLTHKKIELQNALATIQPENAAQLQRQLTQQQNEEHRLKRQITNRTLDQIWVEANLSEEHRALLHFLLSKGLVGLPIKDTLIDPHTFLQSSQEVIQYLTPDGTFKGFGLSIPKSEWFTPLAANLSLEEQLYQLQQTIKDLQHKLGVAENREQKERNLQNIQTEINQKETTIQKFRTLQTLQAEYGSFEHCQEKHVELQAQDNHLKETISTVEKQLNQQRQQSQVIYSRIYNLDKQKQELEQVHNTIPVFKSSCPAEIRQLSENDLRAEYRLSKGRVRRRHNELDNLHQDIEEAKSKLEAAYDRAASDLSFTKWVETRLDITKEIDRFEVQLQESYNNLITQVKGELDKLTQAYEAVQSKIAALNNLMRNVSISNIQQIQLQVKESELVEAIRQTGQLQMELFSFNTTDFSLANAQDLVDNYLNQIRTYGRELNLEDLFKLEFQVTFSHVKKPRSTFEIHKFESHGTETGIKIVLYLGLIRLLQGNKKVLNARIPFFLDEVGSIDRNNLRQLIAYCDENNFLPIFASPDIRQDIPYNYIFQRNGSRSILINELVITEQTVEPTVESYETAKMDHPPA